MATRRTLLRSIAAASLPAAGASPLASVLFALRVVSPALVLLSTLSLLPSRPLSPPSPSPITPVVVQSRIPRRALILALLSLAAFSFLVDGLAYVVYAVFNGVWRPGTGVELAALLGLVAYAALAALGAYKDANNIEVWTRKRVKASIFIALALDIAQVVLLALSVKTRDLSHICDSAELATCIPETIHFFTPFFRVIFLLPLVFVLLSPRVVYLPADSHPETTETESAPLVGQSTVLQEQGNEAAVGGETGKYGTFVHEQPEPSAVAIHPELQSSLATVWQVGPYVLPEKGTIWLIISLHVLIRIVTPLVPLCLGAVVNAFLSSSTGPIPAPLGTSPYTYIFIFVLLHFLISSGGIPNVSKILVSRLGGVADSTLSSHYVDHVLGLALGSTEPKVPEDLYATADGAITKVLYAVSAVAAVVDDCLIGVVVLGVLFGWEFGLTVLIALGIYGYVTCLTFRPSILSACPAVVPALKFVQTLLASTGLLLGSLYIGKGVTEGLWSAGSWVAWVWYWGALFLPLASTPSLRVATNDARSIFKVLDKPAGVVHGKDTIDSTGGIEIKFDNVSLTYPYTETQEPLPTLNGVSFVLPADSVTAIISAPSSPKSSVLKALFHLYDVDSGAIYLNGIPVHSLSATSLRSFVAVVPNISENRTKAVLRALEKNAKVVLVEGVLDRTLVGGRTVVWEVGMDGLDGLEGVDHILVLKDGQLVETGPFKELVQADGLFASLWTGHVRAGMPVPGSSSASGVAEGYDASIAHAQSIDGQIGEAPSVDSPRAVTASIRAPTASIRAPSIRPTVSVRADSIAPSVPTKDFPFAVSFPSARDQPEPVAFPVSTDVPVSVAFPASPAPAPIAFPKTDDSRSIESGSQAHVRLPTTITFDTPITPPRVSTPDPTGASASPPETEGKRKRISSQNFQRLARRISLSTPRKGVGIQGIPGIAGIAGVLRRDTSMKSSDKSNGEIGTRESIDITGGSSSAPETARNSGEINAERTEKDKEREEKKRKRKSFMEVVGAKWGDSGAIVTPPATDGEVQGPSAGEA